MQALMGLTSSLVAFCTLLWIRLFLHCTTTDET